MNNLVVSPIVPLWLWILALALTLGGALLILVSKKRVDSRWWLTLSITILLFLVALNPGINVNVEAEETSDAEAISRVDVMLVVDTTSSIAAEDWGEGQTRLSGVKADITEIVKAYNTARFGLITFDSIGVDRVPLTTNSTALLSSVDTLRQEVTANSFGSSVGVAAENLLSTLISVDDPNRQTLVFFFSDGENTIDGLQASYADAAPYVDAGAVLGYGTAEGAPMKKRVSYNEPSEDEYITDSAGNQGISSIDETNLQRIADELEVTYVHRSADEPLNVSVGTEDSVVESLDVAHSSIFGFYWVFAIGAGILMLVAVFLVIRDIRRTTGGGRKRQ